jgi:hypothetical protein
MTMVELMIALTIMTVVLASLVGLFESTQGAYEMGSSVMELESRGNRVMRKLVGALRAARGSTLDPRLAPPLSSNRIDFEITEGFDGKHAVTSRLRRIEHDAATSTVSWTDGIGTANPSRLVLSRSTPALLQGEIANLADDNGNLLWDEPGLSFCFEGDTLIVRLTLQAERDGGRRIERTWETRLNCRN